MADQQTSYNITGRDTTAGAPEQTLDVSLNGAVAAASVAVPAGSRLVFADVTISGVAVSNWRVQQTNDGAAWFDLLPLRLPGDGNIGQTLGTGYVVTGGANVAVRVRVETTGGAALVGCNIQGTLNTFL